MNGCTAHSFFRTPWPPPPISWHTYPVPLRGGFARRVYAQITNSTRRSPQLHQSCGLHFSKRHRLTHPESTNILSFSDNQCATTPLISANGTATQQPEGRRIHVRMDAGFYAREIVEFLVGRGLEFSISARLTEALRADIDARPEESWKPYPWEEGTEYAELSYKPSSWPHAFRMLVKRQPLHEGNQLVLGGYFYTPVITNRRGAASSLLKYHLARGGAENISRSLRTTSVHVCFPARTSWRTTRGWSSLSLPTTSASGSNSSCFQLHLTAISSRSSDFTGSAWRHASSAQPGVPRSPSPGDTTPQNDSLELKR